MSIIAMSSLLLKDTCLSTDLRMSTPYVVLDIRIMRINAGTRLTATNYA